MAEAVKKRKWRYIFVMVALGAAGLAVLARYASLALAPPKEITQAMTAAGERGRIFDRKGRLLAVDTPLYDISVWKPDTEAAAFPDEIKALAALSGSSAEIIKARWDDKKSKYFYIGKRLPPSAMQALQEGKAKGQFKGVKAEAVSGRLYPEGRLASHLLGFTGEGNKGLEGIEIKYDKELSPAGSLSADKAGQSVPSGKESLRGYNLVLTIDAELQFLLEDIARKAMAETRAEAVFIIAMDVRSGELLAYVCMPDFDPNYYQNFTLDQRQDRLTGYAYEPGSVFKVYSMASILDVGAIKPETTFVCTGVYTKTTPRGEKITIHDLGVHGNVNLEGILANSCNVGVSYSADRVTDQQLYDHLRNFGFGTATGVGLSGENPGSLRSPDAWSGRSKQTIAIGQESLTTPLQMAQAAAAVANGGTLFAPYTVKRVEKVDGSLVKEYSPVAVRSVISPATSRKMLTAMESVASLQGTGWRAKVPDVRMAVKTGTAQMIDRATRAYSSTDYIASTLGILPADDPKVAIYIAVVKPRGEQYLGGRIAAPLVRDAAEAALTTLDLPRGNTPTVSHSGEIKVSKPDQVLIGDTMPDLSGTPKRLLLGLLARTDIRVKINGDGYVVRQSPLPGAPVGPGESIVLDLQ